MCHSQTGKWQLTLTIHSFSFVLNCYAIDFIRNSFDCNLSQCCAFSAKAEISTPNLSIIWETYTTGINALISTLLIKSWEAMLFVREACHSYKPGCPNLSNAGLPCFEQRPHPSLVSVDVFFYLNKASEYEELKKQNSNPLKSFEINLD